jgi:hypothetical protein
MRRSRVSAGRGDLSHQKTGSTLCRVPDITKPILSERFKRPFIVLLDDGVAFTRCLLKRLQVCDFDASAAVPDETTFLKGLRH